MVDAVSVSTAAFEFFAVSMIDAVDVIVNVNLFVLVAFAHFYYKFDTRL